MFAGSAGVPLLLAAAAVFFSAAGVAADDLPAPAATANLLTATTNPAGGMFPAFGNGFLAGDAGCGARPACPGGKNDAPCSCGKIHLGGVFNVVAQDGAQIPHRAGLSNPFAVTVRGAVPGSVSQLSFDTRLGVFRNATRVKCQEGFEATVTTQTYAHRAFRSLLVFEIGVAGLSAAHPTCSVSVDSCSVSAAEDFETLTTTQGATCASGDANVEWLPGVMVHDRHPAVDMMNLDATHLTAQQCADACCATDGCVAFVRVGDQATPAGNCTAPHAACCWLKPTVNMSRLHEACASCDSGIIAAPVIESLVVKKVETPPYPTGLPPPPRTEVGVAYARGVDPATPIALTAQRPSRLFLAAYRTSLEPDVGVGGAAAKAAAADLARYGAMTSTALLAAHQTAWNALWEGGLELKGNTTFAASVNSSLFYLLSSVRADWPYGMSPGGLARDDYQGHTFWDQETWMFPNLVALAPALAAACLEYRQARLPAARARAQHHNLSGGMQPWESGLTGFGVAVWKLADEHEIHITADVAMAARLYFRASQNMTWLKHTGWPLAQASAEYFASRVVVDPDSGNFTLLNVIPPDEKAGVVNSSAYTNAAAAETLRFGVEVANLLGFAETASASNWTQIADQMLVPIGNLDGVRVHLEFDGYKAGTPINQADVALLQYPLGLAMEPQLATNDLAVYQAVSSGPSTAGFYTGDSAYSISWLQVGNRSAADAQLQLAFAHMDLSHFNVWKEKSFGDFGNLNFLTGAGGYIQNMLMGYGGLRFRDDGLFARLVLPPLGVTEMRLRRVAYQDARITFTVDDDQITVELESAADDVQSFTVKQIGHENRPLELLKPARFPAASELLVAVVTGK